MKPGPSLSLHGIELPTVVVPPGELTLQFDRTFEEVGEMLGRIERLFFEPDGSFVWTSSDHEQPWQLDGVVYDREGQIVYVDLKGSCPPERLDQMLTTLDWPSRSVIFQLMREALFVEEAIFRRYAAVGIAES